jgi:PAS domain S-box-containing protein
VIEISTSIAMSSNLEPVSVEKLTQQILQCMPEALVFADLDGIIRIWNPGAETVFGFTAADAIGQSLDLIIPERMRKAHWDGFNEAIKRGGTKPGRKSAITRSLHKSGEQIYVDMSFAMVFDQDGKMMQPPDSWKKKISDASLRSWHQNLRTEVCEAGPLDAAITGFVAVSHVSQ